VDSLLQYLRPRRLPEHETLLNSSVPTLHVDPLSDEDLDRLNHLLPWKCYTVDGHGRPFGGVAGRTKRHTPQSVPDPRIVDMDRHFGLAGKSVLELGCFEGVHTIALCQHGADVIAIDARIENVVKTIVRANLFGFRPQVACVDVDKPENLNSLPEVDLAHHVGVLYHLADPISHLAALAPLVKTGMLLDTHISPDGEDGEAYEALGESWPYFHYRERGRNDVFSGMDSEAKWLTLDTLHRALERAGFSRRTVIRVRQERNGPRAHMYCSRS
jgi:2-polyprenyl-3-methyl-5-hydroxy-6-metoxy-1,4-benzoquinol methylase